MQGLEPVQLAQAKTTTPILASFDSENAVIWVNEALLDALRESRSSGRSLPERDVITLCHEFVHVWQHREVFEQFESREERAAELIRRRAELAAGMTEEEYVNHVLAAEKQAETGAQRISHEMLNHFQRARGEDAFPRELLNELAEERAALWIQDAKKSYARKAREGYQSLRATVQQEGGAEGAVKSSQAKKKTTQKLLPVAKIQDVFPIEKSVTLKKLLGLMVRYNIMIVVSVTQEGI